MSVKLVTPMVLLILILLPLFGKTELCCKDEDCEELCKKNEKTGICTGNPNCQTTSTGLGPDKTTGQGKCKCISGDNCCNDQDCDCKIKGYFGQCRTPNCHSQLSAKGDADIVGQGKCQCFRQNGCCHDDQCKLKCSKGTVNRCVGSGKLANLCSTGRCECNNKCNTNGFFNAANDCEKTFGFKCSSNSKNPIASCNNGTCSCSNQATCTMDSHCKGRLNPYPNKLQDFEQLVCTPKKMEAHCDLKTLNGKCICRPKFNCTTALCHDALKSELDCCYKRFNGNPGKQKGCADENNKAYSTCVKKPDCYRDESEKRLRLPGEYAFIC